MRELTRVVLVAIDGLGHDALAPDETPALWGLAGSGGGAPARGRASMPATTYPSFASLLTGADPEVHGVRTTARRAGAVPGWAGLEHAAVPTLVHVARAAGLPARAILGDHRLQAVLRLDDDGAWPPRGTVPPGVAVDGHGYPANDAVAPILLEVAAGRDWRLLFVHLNELDTIGHDLGPTSEAWSATLHATDDLVGRMVDVLRPAWRSTVVVVVSDHGMETRGPAAPLDPGSHPRTGPEVADWIADGSAAWVRPRGLAADCARALAGLPGVAEARTVAPDRVLALAAPGHLFAGPGLPAAGVHGSRSTAATVAIVGGGHPAARALAAVMPPAGPPADWWSPRLAGVLGIADAVGPTSRGDDGPTATVHGGTGEATRPIRAAVDLPPAHD